MRWELLFADLESRLDSVERADLDAEIEERTRAERAAVTQADRFAAHRGAPVRVTLRGGSVAMGAVADVAGAWVLLDAPDGQAAIPLAAVVAVEGLGHGAAPLSEVRRRLTFASALRELAEAGPEIVLDTDAGRRAGRIVAVGADHVDLVADGRAVTVALAAIVAVRSSHALP